MYKIYTSRITHDAPLKWWLRLRVLLQYLVGMMAVEFASATAGMGAGANGINRNHVEICKFPDPNVVEYTELVEFIKQECLPRGHEVQRG